MRLLLPKNIMKKSVFLLLLLFPFIFSQRLDAQISGNDSVAIRKDAVKLYIDCRRCDMDFIREEIPYVNYVRDTREAEVYLLESSQSTGSGGTAYTYTFIGQMRFAGMRDTLIYNTNPDETSDQTREGRTKMMKAGLMRFVAKSPLIREVDISHNESLESEEVIDNWDNWVFEIETEPNFEIEESLSEFSWDNAVQASRITADWKMEFDFDQSFKETNYIDDGENKTGIKKSWQQENLIVKSITDHWSVGASSGFSSSSYRNLQFNFNFFPSVEYNIYPYSEATRKQFRILYGFGYLYNNYRDSTIYDMTSENLFEQHLQFAYRIQDKWGSANISLVTSVFMHDLSKNLIELDGYVRIRVIKGLSLQISGSVGRIHNQIGLAKGTLNPADILLRLQELATGYRIDGSLGIVYTFGSIYNNVVNPRFGN
jgi:hypothetical protein